MFAGIYPPIVTHFNADRSVDSDTNHRHIDFLIDRGVHGIFALGTTGEFMHLTLSEREELAQDTIRHVNGRIPVIVGTGSTSTFQTVRLSRHAAGAGASAVAIITPYYLHLSDQEIIAHYSAVANAVDIPVLIYSFPALTGTNVSTDAVCELVAENPNIAGIKDSAGSIDLLWERIARVKAIKPDFAVLTGSASYLFPVLAMGGDGAIPATANFAPDEVVAVYEYFQRGDLAKAARAWRQVLLAHDVFRLPGSVPALTKAAMVLLGLADSATNRPPVLALTPEAGDRLKHVLQEAELLDSELGSSGP
jgi:4-hydroxy-tetrahydrodipicolinate synthase